MLIVTHDWNGSAIAQLTEATKIAKYDVPAGYVNATQMCKACDKQWGHYAALDTTKAYWEALSADIGIPISGLVLSIKGGNEKQVQGTWTHPEIAIDLAQWVSVEFRIWANRTLKQVIQNQSEPVAQPQDRDEPQYTVVQPQEPQPALPPAVPTPQEIAQVVDLMLGRTELHPNLIAGAIGSAIGRIHPRLLPAIELAKTLLPIPIESELVRPTALAEKLTESTGEKWSAVRVNKVLIEQGFQVKNPDGGFDPTYLPTPKGKEHSELVVETAKGHGKTIQSLRWYFSVLEALEMNDH